MTASFEPAISTAGSSTSGLITLHIPATPAHTSIARSAVAATLVQVGATVDDVEDLRLAISEACALLLEHAAESELIEITLDCQGADIYLSLTTKTTNPAPELTASLSWTVLTTLLTSVESVVVRNDELTSLTLTLKHRVQIPR